MDYWRKLAERGKGIAGRFGATYGPRPSREFGSFNDSNRNTNIVEPNRGSGGSSGACAGSSGPSGGILVGRSGRPAKYDWDLIFQKVKELYDSKEPPESHIAGARQVVRWMETLHQEPPDEDYLRLQISKYLRARFAEDATDPESDTQASLSTRLSIGRLTFGATVVALLMAAGISAWILSPPAQVDIELKSANADIGRWVKASRHAAVAHALFATKKHAAGAISDQDKTRLLRELSDFFGAPLDPPASISIEGGYELVGGRVLPGWDGPAAQFMYTGPNGALVSLYLTETISLDQKSPVRYGEQDDIAVTYWSDDQFAYFVCAPLADVEREALWQATSKLSTNPKM